ncbi:hypothetical protein KY285_035139 [Solanum tuberosum]|nr:hypothetical protein KY285_035139 [Solanum tuberosum]
MSEISIEDQHVVTINWEINKTQLELMQQKISQSPQLLSESAGRSSCCIFRVPQSFINVNGRSYEPQIVSIGPYHRGKDNVKMIEEHKWRFLGNLVKRTKEKGLNLEDYLKAIQPFEMRARECYSEAIVLNRDEFVEMLVLDEPKNRKDSPTNVIQCISKLRRAGIKLRPRKEDTFLAIKFNNGFIEMPTITIDDFMSSFLINCVAYEQCHVDCTKHMTTYATFLDCLVNTQHDVEYLCDCNIIENYFGTDFEIANFINNLGKDVMFDIDECYLLELFIKLELHGQIFE